MNRSLDPDQYRSYLEGTAEALRKTFGPAPDFAVVFGSGLGTAFLERFPHAEAVPFRQIPHWMDPRVEGHSGEILQIQSGGHESPRTLVLRGRIHYYEGYPPEQVVFPVRAMALWGIKRLVLTNSSGSIRDSLRPGRLAWIRDHLNFTGVNPLRGPNLDFLGVRFPSLRSAYDNSFSRRFRETAKRLRMSLPSAVYVGIAGPSYETEAEIRAFRKLGGELIGMSTVLEAIAAAHAGVEVTALSAVTNSCLHRKRPLNHAEVLANARRVDLQLAKLLWKVLSKEGG